MPEHTSKFPTSVDWSFSIRDWLQLVVILAGLIVTGSSMFAEMRNLKQAFETYVVVQRDLTIRMEDRILQIERIQADVRKDVAVLQTKTERR